MKFVKWLYKISKNINKHISSYLNGDKFECNYLEILFLIITIDSIYIQYELGSYYT